MPLPNDQRPSLRELASRSAGPPAQIAGKPAAECPYCGCSMFVDGTRPGEKVTFRYVYCRNRNCGRRFLTKQTNAVIVREIGDSELPSRTG